MPGGEKLSRRKELLIAGLLQQSTIQAAARAAGISERTARNWMREPSFRRAYREARQAVLERTTALLLALTSEAIVTLHNCMNAEDASVRLRAAMAVLAHVSDNVAKLDLAEDLAELR